MHRLHNAIGWLHGQVVVLQDRTVGFVNQDLARMGIPPYIYEPLLSRTVHVDCRQHNQIRQNSTQANRLIDTHGIFPSEMDVHVFGK